MVKGPRFSKGPLPGECSGQSKLFEADNVEIERTDVFNNGIEWVNLISKEIVQGYPEPLQKYEGTFLLADIKQICHLKTFERN